MQYRANSITEKDTYSFLFTVQFDLLDRDKSPRFLVTCFEDVAIRSLSKLIKLLVVFDTASNESQTKRT